MKHIPNMDSDNRITTMGRNKSKLKTWRKNLYDNKGYKDNYTDVSFLEEMRKNVNFKEIHYSTAFAGASLVTQQICVVVLFSLVFVIMDFDWAEPTSVLYLCGFMTAIGYVSRIYLSPRLERFGPDSTKVGFSSGLIVTDVVTVIKCLALGHILSPVLKTLTETISTDTIQAAAAIAFTVHLATYDYGIGNEPGLPFREPSPMNVNAPSHWSEKSTQLTEKASAMYGISGEKSPRENLTSASENVDVKESRTASLHLHSPSRATSALSLNAAIFGAICLASRLASPSHAFALLSAAGLAFALGPPFLRLLYSWSPARVIVPVSLILATVYFIFLCCGGIGTGEDWLVNLIPLALFLLVIAFVNVLCPCMFVLWQAHKDNIYGPWDEAVPLIPHTAHDAVGNT